MSRKVILCYGDSNTHGTKPLTQPGMLQRFGPDERWPGLLQERLGSAWQVIEEGLPARTTVHDDPIEGEHKNGLSYLRACLESQLPVDLLILMLGTNDLKPRFSASAADIAGGIGRLLREIIGCAAGPSGGRPRILLISPVPIEEIGFLGDIFQGGAAKSRLLAPLLRDVAVANGVDFLDAGLHAVVSPVDGIHYEADQHVRLADAVAGMVTG